MLTVNQAQMRQVWPFLGERPPVIVDWLPWSHTFGGSHNFNMMLANGGSLYIDHGKPTPDGIGVSIRNLSEISQTISFNVPRAYGMLLPHLERDAALRRRFFAELDMIFYAAAALPQPIWEALERLARQERSALPNGALERNDLPLMASSWGMTETAPACTTVHAAIEHTGVIGVPLPGTAAKLVPNGEKLELRVRGPNVTPGYLADPAATAALFDEEGFLLTGDAVRLADPARLEAGLVFDGRLAEDFKLSTGSWVSVSHMRVAAIAGLAPVAQDAVVAGHDRDEIGLLVFPDLAATARLVGLDATPAELLRHEAVRAHVRERLRALAETGAGSSTRICRVLLLVEPPSLDANEITDKGYLNQRAVLTRRAHLVERLYDDRDPDVIRL
jgi:feruloyl-CoA synthase